MTLWAIVPVKPFRSGKTRLSDVLTPLDRINLNRHLLSHTLDTLSEASGIDHIIVVSRDQSALSLAREHGVLTLEENNAPLLNMALTYATDVVRSLDSCDVLILPADLPLITPKDVQVVLEYAKGSPIIAIVPDRRREGTNALLIHPAGLVDYEFGTNSFQKHCESARQARVRLEICELSSMALDIDLPEDLDLARQVIENWNSKNAIDDDER